MFAAATLGVALLAAPAAAYPVKGVPELTHNPLYKKGKLPKISCKLSKGTTEASTEKYLRKLVGCLNDAWKPIVDDYQPVSVDIKRKQDDRCTGGTEMVNSYAVVCGTFIRVQLGADWIKAKDDLPVFLQVTAAFGGVVQGQTGIGEAWWALGTDIEEEEKELNRRFDLQQYCLSGAAVKSLGRTARNWKPLLHAEDPEPKDKGFSKFFTHKPTANEVSWFTRGYKAGGPGACNTWTASSAKVA
ncbi:hypothetical protein Plo01_48950 [Planobispora longispora]|uniref:Metalloprotease n=1 Tax=Planobispora longispora TaxID=28887 RepID=A0A8J3W845_9ACTN|nr:hypothetical protein GCM10020093_065890 [Planobispora longispora]GIH78466.1 hypothetical protein Plo01_48950 [Planobispora longispora]